MPIRIIHEYFSPNHHAVQPTPVAMNVQVPVAQPAPVAQGHRVEVNFGAHAEEPMGLAEQATPVYRGVPEVETRENALLRLAATAVKPKPFVIRKKRKASAVPQSLQELKEFCVQNGIASYGTKAAIIERISMRGLRRDFAEQFNA
jgi:hypothetical protein